MCEFQRTTPQPRSAERSAMRHLIGAVGAACGALIVGLCVSAATPEAAAAAESAVVAMSGAPLQRIMEGMPERFVARKREKQARLAQELREHASAGTIQRYAVILQANKWRLGSTITVAFKGGTPRLHELIARVASEWSNYANIKLDFGRDERGNYRTWSTNDSDYSADIRISFDAEGYWSALGAESIDPDLHQPFDASMNLDNYDKRLPLGWAGTIRHEFGHAIGLVHEHQHPAFDCDWRWDDEDGYEPTTDDYGEFIVDTKGRHPGIYTRLGGPPNKWPKGRVDANVRKLTDESAYGFGGFDKLSIMKYFFDDGMYVKGKDSACYTPKENNELSQEDKRRIVQFYPGDAVVAAAQAEEQTQALNALLARVPEASELANATRRRLKQLNPERR